MPVNERKRVAYAIEQLPNGEDIKKLKGHDNLLRLRVGDYRIIYSVDNGKLIVYVIDIDNRGDIKQWNQLLAETAHDAGGFAQTGEKYSGD